MADETYNLHYKGDNSDLLGKTNTIVRALRLLDQVADRLIAKLGKLFGGPARSAGTAAARFNEAAAALRGVDAAAKGAGTSLQSVHASAGQTSASVGGVAASFLALQAARAVLNEVLDASKELEEYWKNLAKEATDFRESLRELANVRGEKGPNNNVTADQVDLAVGAGMTPEKAAKLAQNFANFSQAVRDKGHVTPGEEQSVLTEAGRTARRMGIDEGAMGDALGAAGLFHGIHDKAQAMEQVGGALKGLQRGSVKYNAGLDALNVASAKLVDSDEARADGSAAGKLGSYAEAGVFLGALSLGTGGKAFKAGHQMVQISRTLNPAADKEGQNAALKAAGITPDMSDSDKLIRLSKFLKSQGISPLKWLEANKLGSQATRESTVAGLKQADVLEKWLNESRESQRTGATGRATIADNDEYLKTDRSATAASLKGIESSLNKVEGIEGPEEFEKAKQAAEQRIRLKEPGYQKSLFRSFVNKAMTIPDYLSHGVGGEGFEQENDLQAGAIPVMRREAKRLGIDVDKEFPDLGSHTYKTRADAFTKASDRVRKAGGDPLRLDELQDLTRQRNNATREGTVPVGRGPGGAGGGPDAAGGGDPRVVSLLEQQLREQQRTNAKLGGGPGAPPRLIPKFGPLPVDAPDGGPRRGG